MAKTMRFSRLYGVGSGRKRLEEKQKGAFGLRLYVCLSDYGSPRGDFIEKTLDFGGRKARGSTDL